MLRRLIRVFFLNASRIREQNRAEFARGRVGINRSGVTLLANARKPAAVIEMRVREHDLSIDFRSIGSGFQLRWLSSWFP